MPYARQDQPSDVLAAMNLYYLYTFHLNPFRIIYIKAKI